MRVGDIIVIYEMLADVEVVGFRLDLRGLDGLADRLALDMPFLFHSPVHEALYGVAAESPHQVVIERDIEASLSRVALPARAAAKLVVYAPRLMALSAQNEQAAKRDNLVVIFLPLFFGDAEHVAVAAEDDVGAASRHVGGDRNRAGVSRLRHDIRLTLVLLRVQDFVLDARLAEHAAEHFGLVDVGRAYQHRLSGAAALPDFAHDGAVLRVLVRVDEVLVVLPDHRHVGGDFNHFQLVYLPELFALGCCRSRHSGELVVQLEVVLKGYRRVGNGFALYSDVFLRLDSLMQAFRVPAPVHQPSRELIDDYYLPVLHYIVPVALENCLRLERVFDKAHESIVVAVVEGADSEYAFQMGDALNGQGACAVLFVNRVVFIEVQPSGDAREPAVFAVVRLLRRAAYDERGSGFVDEDVVHLVNDGELQLALHALAKVDDHVVAEVVEAELVVGAVGDVGGVGIPALYAPQVVHAALRGFRVGVEQVSGFVLEHSNGRAEEVIYLSHPLGVSAGEVVVDGYHMDAAGERVQIGGQGGDKRLALAGSHLGDFALMQHHAADKLDVEVAHSENALGSLAHYGERFGQDVVDVLAAIETLAELEAHNGEFGVRLALEVAFEVVDFVNDASEFFERALVRAAKQLSK